MRVSTFVALFCLVALASAETLSTARLRADRISADEDLSEESFVQLQETAFGKNLMSMLSVKYQTSGQLKVVLDLLDKLAGKIRAQQVKETKEYTTQRTDWENDIKHEQEVIRKAKAQIAKLKAERKRLLAELKEDRANLAHDEKALADAISDLAKYTQIRKEEHEKYLEHMEVQKSILGGVHVVKEIIEKLLGNKEVNQGDLSFIIDQLDNLVEEIKVSIKTETAAENAAQKNFEAVKASMLNSIAALRKRIAYLKARIAWILNRLIEIKNEIAQLEEVIMRAMALIAHLEAEIKELDKHYNHNRKVRAEQLALIAKVRHVLTMNPKQVQAYLNKA
jgi:chromosome segregation ATPase